MFEVFGFTWSSRFHPQPTSNHVCVLPHRFKTVFSLKALQEQRLAAGGRSSGGGGTRVAVKDGELLFGTLKTNGRGRSAKASPVLRAELLRVTVGL